MGSVSLQWVPLTLLFYSVPDCLNNPIYSAKQNKKSVFIRSTHIIRVQKIHLKIKAT
jgi:hypothetical protein